MAKTNTAVTGRATARARSGSDVKATDVLLRIGLYALALVLAVFCLFPFYWALVSSLKPDAELFQMPPTLFPHSFTLSNYNDALVLRPFPRNILNSIIVSITTTILCLVVGTFCAYALARLHFRGRSLVLGFILAVITFPLIAIINPLFVEIRNFGWINTYQGLVVPYLAFSLPFSIWLLVTFFRDLPHEIEEAALVDGCTHLSTIYLIILPLAAPALVTVGLLTFINAWQELLFALIFTVDDSTRTIPAGIIFFSGEHSEPWGALMAAAVVVTIPLIILVLVFQQRIVAGLTAGSVKG